MSVKFTDGDGVEVEMALSRMKEVVDRAKRLEKEEGKVLKNTIIENTRALYNNAMGIDFRTVLKDKRVSEIPKEILLTECLEMGRTLKWLLTHNNHYRFLDDVLSQGEYKKLSSLVSLSKFCGYYLHDFLTNEQVECKLWKSYSLKEGAKEIEKLKECRKNRNTKELEKFIEEVEKYLRIKKEEEIS